MPPDPLREAAQHLQAGQPERAIAFLRQAALRDPFDPRVAHDLGLAYLETGRLAEAVDSLRHAASLNPAYTDAHFRLGIALEKSGDLTAAVRAYDRATELLPGHTEAWFRAGALVFQLGHRAEAIGCFRRAAATGPKTRFGRLGAARALLAEEKDADAEKALRQALALFPDLALAIEMLGHVLAESGRFEEARDCFARAIAQAPLLAGSYYDLVRCRPLTAADGDLPARMQAASATLGLDGPQRLSVHLALGKAHDDLGDPEAAMRAWDAAYAERRRIAPFDSAGFERQVDRLIERFSARRLAEASPARTDALPVLIVGLPRSGTTLVEQIVSSHPGVAGGGELNFWNERAPGCIDEADLRGPADDYLALLRSIGPRAERVTDKMPFNFLWAGLVHLALPGATIVHCRRAAIDTALSIHQTHFNPTLAFPTGGAELVAYIRAYEKLMAHWRRALPPARFHELAYDELTQSPEPVIRRLVEACGLDWDPACLRPERNPRVVRTASKWQARQPITPRPMESWRRFSPWLGELEGLLRQEVASSATE